MSEDALSRIVFGDAAEREHRDRLRAAIHADWERQYNPINGTAWAVPTDPDGETP